MMMASVRKLREAGVIGINERNESLVGRYNRRRDIRLVDDKITTKRLADQAGIPTPRLYGAIDSLGQTRRAGDLIDVRRGAVIKPAHGSQGKGILILMGQADSERETWLKAGGTPVRRHDIHFHLSNVMSGMFSLGGEPDTAMIEERVEFDPVFDDIACGGVPDVRIIVVRGIPVAAMLRLPTRASDGKANLHQGGVGVGIHLATGLTRGAMHEGRRISVHPDTQAPLNDLPMPAWQDMMRMAARAFDVTRLGYLGVDIVLDKAQGPLLLELNARPGLAIQIANGEGLRARIRALEALDTSRLDVDARLALASSLAGA